ncbi:MULTISPECIES: transglycosylase SLT domain-containing protein [Sphingomonas]|uniref:Transglycosylase SLT domain-containing protein n=1 Tax=Sphingomonas molluscorum TaxID=418184 RepID=A0ABU8Q792_9SPHN|nr:transglycosylase SLT domain-containing protein [Sphingomonas sp. JUb134]MBM7406924.1 hypothetical protein [Sphingomonas sp. JUb134]
MAEQEERNAELLDNAAAKALDNEATQRINAILRTGESAFFTKKGFDAVNARKPVEQALTDLHSELASRATTERQRRMFTAAWTQRTASDLSDIARYSGEQLAEENKRQSVGRMELSQQNAVMFADDDARFSEHLETGLGELRAIANDGGWLPESLTAAEARYKSETYAAVVRAKLATDDVDGAKSYLDAHRGAIDWKDEATLDAALTPVLQKRQAYADVDRHMGLPATSKGEDAPATTPGTMFDAIVGIESRGRQFAANGQPLTSPKGAVGIAQIMPETGPEAARLAKLPWDESRFRSDAQYNQALGRAYFEAQLRKYGDPRLAAAAYNAGPGRVDQALRKGGRVSWLEHVPPETRAYVAKFGTSVGAEVVRRGPQRVDLAGTLERIEVTAAAEGWSFERRQRAQEEAERRTTIADRLKSRDEAEALDDVLTRADQLGDGFTDVTQLGPAFERLPPAQRTSLRDQARANARPLPIAANSEKAIELKIMAARDPEAFKAIGLREYRHLITPGELASLAVDQAQLRAKPADAPPTANLRSEIDTAIRFHGKNIGLDVGKRSTGTQRKQYGHITDVMRVYVERVTGGKRAPTDDELKAAFDSATMKVIVRGDGWFSEDKAVRRFEVQSGDGRIGIPIPPAIHERIVNIFYREAGRKPTDEEIAQAYLRNKGRPKFWD